MAATIAFAAHTGKFTARAAVTPSPEPASNVALSTEEDVIAISPQRAGNGASLYSDIAAGIVAVGLLVVAIVVRLVWKGMLRLLRAARKQIAQAFGGQPENSVS